MHFWLWPNLLSLDAPIVALLWQAFLARCFDIPLRLPAQLVLGLTVWAIYLTDRQLDALQPAPEREAARHRFHRRWHRWITVFLILILAADMVITLTWLRPAVFHHGLFALAGVVAYLGFLHFRGVALPKEFLVAALFTTGVFLVGWTNASSDWPLIFAALAFFTLCLGNLFAIDLWERAEFRASSGLAAVSLPVLYSGLTALAIVCGLVGSRWYLAVAVSAMLIMLLCFLEKKMGYELRRVLVDWALLSPLLFWN